MTAVSDDTPIPAVAGPPPLGRLAPQQLFMLHGDLHPDSVSKRPQSTRPGAKILSYLETWFVKSMLIQIFGYAGFSAECIDAKIVNSHEVAIGSQKLPGHAVSAQATVRLTIHATGAVYQETAVATNIQASWGDAAGTAMKTAESDALKRCAVYLGTKFGLSLYDDGRLVNVVRSMADPDQAPIIQAVEDARRTSAGKSWNTMLEEFQARFNVKPNSEPPSGEEPPPSEPARRQRTAARARTGAPVNTTAPPPRRMEAARRALADAESAVGVKGGEQH